MTLPTFEQSIMQTDSIRSTMQAALVWGCNGSQLRDHLTGSLLTLRVYLRARVKCLARHNNIDGARTTFVLILAHGKPLL